MMATRERPPMIPATRIPAPSAGGAPGPPGPPTNPGGTGRGPLGSGGRRPALPSCVARGENGSGRPPTALPTRAASLLGFTGVEATLVGTGSPGAGAPGGVGADVPAFGGAPAGRVADRSRAGLGGDAGARPGAGGAGSGSRGEGGNPHAVRRDEAGEGLDPPQEVFTHAEAARGVEFQAKRKRAGRLSRGCPGGRRPGL